MAVQTQVLPVIDSVDEIRRFTIEELYKMSEAGLFYDEHVELISGYIIAREKQSTAHIGIRARLIRMLLEKLMNKSSVFTYLPLTVNSYNWLEADVGVAKFRDDDYITKSPEAKDIQLFIEVADISLEKDRNVKMPLYANANIREYWIINLKDRQIETFKEPQNADYQAKNILKAGETAICEHIDFQLSVDELFKNLNS